MNRLLMTVATAGLLAAFAHGEDGPVQEGKGHLFACADYSGGKLFIYTPEGKIEWEYAPAPHCNELLSRVVFRGPGSGGVLQDSVGENFSFENKNDLLMPVESSPTSAG